MYIEDPKKINFKLMKRNVCMKAIYAGNILFHNFNIKDKKWETKNNNNNVY